MRVPFCYAASPVVIFPNFLLLTGPTMGFFSNFLVFLHRKEYNQFITVLYNKVRQGKRRADKEGCGMYQIGDKIAHPMHGAGVIESMAEQCVGGKKQAYYVVHMTVGTMTVMIPCDHCDSVGVRRIITREQADSLLEMLPELEIDETQNWNRRFRENMLKIKSGDLLQVAQVAKSLLRRENKRGLSTGERKLLSSARQILISEIMLAKDGSYEEIAHMVDDGLIKIKK